jgi:hypothetical protein
MPNNNINSYKKKQKNFISKRNKGGYFFLYRENLRTTENATTHRWCGTHKQRMVWADKFIKLYFFITK